MEPAARGAVDAAGAGSGDAESMDGLSTILEKMASLDAPPLTSRDSARGCRGRAGGAMASDQSQQANAGQHPGSFSTTLHSGNADPPVTCSPSSKFVNRMVARHVCPPTSCPQ